MGTHRAGDVPIHLAAALMVTLDPVPDRSVLTLPADFLLFAAHPNRSPYDCFALGIDPLRSLG
jgi:hypothetical protein